MKLKSQLLLVSLLMLLIPWAGCQFVKEVEGVLRLGQTQSLSASAGAIASALSNKSSLIYSPEERQQSDRSALQSIYFSALDADIIVDGYDDGWPSISSRIYLKASSFDLNRVDSSDTEPSQVKLKAGLHGDDYYLFFSVTDNKVIYHNPTLTLQGNGDRFVVVLGGHRTPVRKYLISSAAPGKVRVRIMDSNATEINTQVINAQVINTMAIEYGIQGVWQDTAEGFDLEIKIPRSLMDGRFGFYRANEDETVGGKVTLSYGNALPASELPPPWVVQPNPQLYELLKVFGRGGASLTVIDGFYWRVARFQGLEKKSESLSSDKNVRAEAFFLGDFWLVQRLFRAILSSRAVVVAEPETRPGRLQRPEIVKALGGESASQWYQAVSDHSKRVLAIAEPIYEGEAVIGVLLAEQSSEEFLSLADNAFGRLLYVSFIVVTVIGLGLLAYASLLSWRIRKLSEAAHAVIGEDGVLKADFSVSTAKDELGDLSRSYARLVYRVKQSSDYLRSLARTLSHELRTPIAIVRSSLENLDNEPLSERGSEYTARAKEGVERLSYILTAMSEANNVEASIENSERFEFDLAQLTTELMQAYESIHTEFNFSLGGMAGGSREVPLGPKIILGVPELVVQLLDKLMDNAASFCPPGGEIKFGFFETQSAYRLVLSNQGPMLPTEMLGQLFDSMVSVREKTLLNEPKNKKLGATGDNAGKAQAHLGLGLYIARLIAEFHGGSIRGVNLPDGSGVQFEVELSKIVAPQLNPD